MESSPAAHITQSQFHQAFSIIQQIDYLPLAYKVDGCYSKALIEAMELASEQIPSSITFAFAKEGTFLTLKDGTQWVFHVAPMIVVDGATTPTILDPSLSSLPMAQTAWLTAMGGQNATVFSVPGSNYGYKYGVDAIPRSSIINSFAALPAFRTDDIRHACKLMYQYIGEEPGLSRLQKAIKKERFLNRLQQLMSHLQSYKKLSGSSDVSNLRCDVPLAVN